MAYFDNGNYNFDDLFNELNRDFFNDGRMTNGQQPMRYSAGQAPQQGAQNGQQQKEKPIGVDLTEQAKKVNMILSLDVQLLLTKLLKF